MSSPIFKDNTFPRHISDIMNLMHMMVFQGTDGEEKWDTYLTPKQKEYIALGLALYYQCDHCIDHHLAALCKLDKISKDTICQHINSMILFLRIDTRVIGSSEQNHWIKAWQRFAKLISFQSNDPDLPYLIALAIGIARNDEFLIDFCGTQVVSSCESRGIKPRAMVGELEAVVIFMKAAASKNRIVDKVEKLFA
ncbi:carboxymuconolactone decarboxylase family protein [Solemya elarraichensis gill symbiont]|uniref:Carboxymuconolactone decarboxylase-like domain-containing protein n=1 Tax=Solemya elarraichensis gill symbiont TaxID=1918949 RepID=A0A1T2L9J3_9GAMM|nr:carboxymuconolactone decarboxylase family protein [Solemya elarraichensis gill symbiont]OOZ41788.1 hypothetical protein BOW52_04075 [Solemya elarraichensis gill symbiont]